MPAAWMSENQKTSLKLRQADINYFRDTTVVITHVPPPEGSLPGFLLLCFRTALCTALALLFFPIKLCHMIQIKQTYLNPNNHLS